MWQRPSPAVAELFESGAKRLMDTGSETFFERIDEASLAQHSPAVSEDPALLGTFRRANRALVTHWVISNLRDPGAEVSPFTGPELEALVRDLVRRGLDLHALEPFRSGQNAAWEAWMATAFELTDDVSELRELLAVSARSIFTYVEATMATTLEMLTRERDELALGTSAERLETLTLILDGEPIDVARAERRLGYALEQPHPHLAAIVWSDDLEAADGALRETATALAAACGAERALSVTATSHSLWSWIPARREPTAEELERLLAAHPAVRVAIGSPEPGVSGFRRSYEEAFTAQRLIGRLDSPLRVARYEDLRLVALVSRDEEQAQHFVDEVLGDLADAPDALRETLRTYLRLQSNASRTAETLFAHRNTVIARVAKAEEMLPRPLADSSLEVGVALEVVYVQEGGD
ncbi:MAG: helix-turn-helix domain-containing protein [Solirubrobacterales bacterium]